MLYGDRSSLSNFDDFDYYEEQNATDSLYIMNASGDDVLYGGDLVAGDLYMFGGYGNDKLFGGHEAGSSYHKLYGDMKPGSTTANDWYSGLPNDGDDLLDLGDSDYASGIVNYGYGSGGNDKIFGGNASGMQQLHGGNGDDKIWAVNPGQFQTLGYTGDSITTQAEGGNGNDIIYGAPHDPSDMYGYEKLFGQFGTLSTTEDGDDIIYTGDSSSTNAKGDLVYGRGGNDKLYGQGGANHSLYGESGDDLLVGGEGNDTLWGDDSDSAFEWEATEGFTLDASVMIGDDTLYGGEGADMMYGGHGDDYLYGEEGDDYLYG